MDAGSRSSASRAATLNANSKVAEDLNAEWLRSLTRELKLGFYDSRAPWEGAHLMELQRMKNPLAWTRTPLFIPGHRYELWDKAMRSSAEAVIIDLEDAVPQDKKDEARAGLDRLAEDARPTKPVVVRINPLDSFPANADLRAIAAVQDRAPGSIQAVMVPKAQSRADLVAVTAEVGPQTPIIPLLESASGILNAQECANSPDVLRLALGLEDLRTELGCEVASGTAAFARATVVLASAAAGLPSPWDSPCTEYRDCQAAVTHAAASRKEGYGGVLCIHPAQLDAIIEGLRPTPGQIEWAHRIIAAGDGAVGVDGEMVDRPVLLRAQHVLRLANGANDGSGT